MPHDYNQKNIQLARVLRKKMTRAEKKLWYDYLRKLPIRIRRQMPIGEYIVDFYCNDAQLVIELDGDQHASKQGVEKDYVRDAYLEQEGILVVRIPNGTVYDNSDGVCEMLDGVIRERMVLLGKEPMKLQGEEDE